MPTSFIIRLRPTGPWRFGPDSGSREHVDLWLHSDAVYSAVTSAMARLDLLDGWLDATARNPEGVSPVRFSSLYPYQRDHLFVVPPRGVWPPPASMKIRYKSARLVPLAVVEALLNDKNLDEDRWSVDGESSCLVPNGWQEGPFRKALRSSASVDRLDHGNIGVHVTACLEFAREAGLWMLVVFAGDEASERWEKPLRSALRLLGDTGIGGERSRGWGRFRDPRWEKTEGLSIPLEEGAAPGYWLLSLYAPAEADSVDWGGGSYTTITRSGRIENPSRWGELKTPTQMIGEGSVLLAPHEPRGAVLDVAPEGFQHPVYRAGFAVTIPIPWKVTA